VVYLAHSIEEQCVARPVAWACVSGAALEVWREIRRKIHVLLPVQFWMDIGCSAGKEKEDVRA